MKKKKNTSTKYLQQFYSILPYAIIIVAALLAYSNSFNCSFQFDDVANITDQTIIKDLSSFTDIRVWSNINIRPLSMFSFAINYHLGQLDVTGYHIVNLIIHIISGFLVFLLIKKVLSIYFSSKETTTTIIWLSLFVALIFTLHPIQTQSVTYIVQRMTSLSGLFYLLAVYLYLLGRTKHSKNGFSSSVLLLYIAVVVSALLSLISKQIAVTIPLALLLIEVCFIRNKDGKLYKKFILISLAVMIAIFSFVALSGKLPRETDQISRSHYFITQFRVITKYVQLCFVPINQNLDYDVRSSVTFWHVNEIASFLLICFLLFLSIFSYKKNKLITFGIGWFFITLSLESTIIPISGLMYEHRLYLALMGFSVCVVVAIYRLLLKHEKVMKMFLIIIVIVYGIATFNRNKVWKNRFTLWSDVLKKSPQKARPYYNMGNILSEAGYQKTAVNYYSKAIELKPDFVNALVNLGNTFKAINNNDKAMYYYKKALEYDPHYTKALNNIGLILTDQGEYLEAKQYYLEALELNPNDAEIINNLGIVWAQLGEHEKALKYFKRALTLKPNYENAKKNIEITKQFIKLNQ